MKTIDFDEYANDPEVRARIDSEFKAVPDHSYSRECDCIFCEATAFSILNESVTFFDCLVESFLLKMQEKLTKEEMWFLDYIFQVEEELGW